MGKKFDLEFREYVTRRTGPYEHRQPLVGSCGAVAGPSGFAVRYNMEYPGNPEVSGVFAIVQPTHPGSSVVSKQRIPGTHVYVLNSSDNTHWFWKPVPGSEAGVDEPVSGSQHQVAMQAGSLSDPTIEQFDPTIEQFDPRHAHKLYLVVPEQ